MYAQAQGAPDVELEDLCVQGRVRVGGARVTFSDAVFQAAFQGVRGASVVVAGGALGVRGKSLRYGAYLDLVGGVTIKLTGSTLTAKAAYTMRK